MPDSAYLFETRYRRAFPGTRGITFYELAEQIEWRLLRLLEQPLAIEGVVPVMWSRGGMGMPVERFERAGDGSFLLNGCDGLHPRCLAAAHGLATPRRFFVYLETESDALLFASAASPLMSGALEEQVQFLLRMCLEANPRAFLPEVAAAMERVRYSPFG